MKPWVVGIFFLLSLVLAAGCATVSSTPTPTPTPTHGPHSPTPTPSFDAVRENLGYALVPDYLPEGFKLYRVEGVGGRPLAELIYRGPSLTRSPRWLSVSYPTSFSPEGYLVEGQATSPKRPRDALAEVTVNGETAHLIRGQWSANTIMQGPGIDPSMAQWDYNVSLALFFDFQVTEEKRVSVAIRAISDPSDWITEEEMVKVAESLKHTE